MAGKETFESLKKANIELRKQLDEEKKRYAQLNREKVSAVVGSAAAKRAAPASV